MTPALVLDDVRRAISDTAAPFRNSDTLLLNLLNQTLKRMVQYRPDLFIIRTNLTLAAGTVDQTLPSDAFRLVTLSRVVNGNAITEVSREVFDRSVPNWPLAPAGTPQHFMRHPRDPARFLVYPQPAAATVVELEYVRIPPVYTINQTITEPNTSYFPVMVDGVVALAEAIDAEHAASGRSQATYTRFLETLGVPLSLRPFVDNDRIEATR